MASKLKYDPLLRYGLIANIEYATATGQDSTKGMSQKAVTDELAKKINKESLDGTKYVMVYGTGTPAQNAIELQAAYEVAKTMPIYLGNLPAGVPTTFMIYKGQSFLTVGPPNPYTTNIDIPIGSTYTFLLANSTLQTDTSQTLNTLSTTIIIAPGEYTFGATKFLHNSAGIDIVSLTGNADVMIDGINVTTTGKTFIKGINCGVNAFTIANNLLNLVCDTCTGGDKSFGGGGGTASGIFTNCTGGDYSFGTEGNASGTLTNCTGGDYSFGGGGTASGTFTNCTGGNQSFGGGDGSAVSGIFTNCTGGDQSFGGGINTTSGTFYNCTGGNNSFGSGGGGTVSGTFTNCTGGDYSFGGGGATTTGAIFQFCTCTTDAGYASGLTLVNTHIFCRNLNVFVPNNVV